MDTARGTRKAADPRAPRDPLTEKSLSVLRFAHRLLLAPFLSARDRDALAEAVDPCHPDSRLDWSRCGDPGPTWARMAHFIRYDWLRCHHGFGAARRCPRPGVYLLTGSRAPLDFTSDLTGREEILFCLQHRPRRDPIPSSLAPLRRILRENAALRERVASLGARLREQEREIERRDAVIREQSAVIAVFMRMDP